MLFHETMLVGSGHLPWGQYIWKCLLCLRTAFEQNERMDVIIWSCNCVICNWSFVMLWIIVVVGFRGLGEWSEVQMSSWYRRDVWRHWVRLLQWRRFPSIARLSGGRRIPGLLWRGYGRRVSRVHEGWGRLLWADILIGADGPVHHPHSVAGNPDYLSADGPVSYLSSYVRFLFQR